MTQLVLKTQRFFMVGLKVFKNVYTIKGIFGFLLRDSLSWYFTPQQIESDVNSLVN